MCRDYFVYVYVFCLLMYDNITIIYLHAAVCSEQTKVEMMNCSFVPNFVITGTITVTIRPTLFEELKANSLPLQSTHCESSTLPQVKKIPFNNEMLKHLNASLVEVQRNKTRSPELNIHKLFGKVSSQ